MRTCKQCGCDFEPGSMANNQRRCDSCRQANKTGKKMGKCRACGGTFKKASHNQRRCDPCRQAAGVRVLHEFNPCNINSFFEEYEPRQRNPHTARLLPTFGKCWRDGDEH